MKRSLALAAGLVVFALPATAFDLSGMRTRTIHGLEGPAMGRGISNEVLGRSSLAAEGIDGLVGRSLRTRFWTIRGEGGIVPNHDHANRPAVFTVLSGEIFEYHSEAPERVLHTAGGLALEEGALAHWWLNEADETVHLIAFDVLPPGRNAATEAGLVPETASADLPQSEGAEHALLGVVNLGSHFGDGTGEGWALTTYRTTIAPGGRFADFTAAGEPLHVFVWQGEVTEHRAGAETLLTARQGSALDAGGTAWWENSGDVPAVLYFGAVEPLSETDGVPREGRLAHGEHKS